MKSDDIRQNGINVDKIRWKGLKVDERGWKWITVVKLDKNNKNGQKWMNVDKNL